MPGSYPRYLTQELSVAQTEAHEATIETPRQTVIDRANYTVSIPPSDDIRMQ